MTMRSNPPWTDKLLRKYWRQLEQLVGAAWMPMGASEHKELASAIENLRQVGIWEAAARHEGEIESADRFAADARKIQLYIDKLRRARALGYREYGCGHYGCVMPTQTAGIVIKVTTDPTEAAFVSAFLSMRPAERPVGIVPYHRIVAIRAESRMRRPVFVLWREEANHVGWSALKDYVRTEVPEAQRPYYTHALDETEDLIVECLNVARGIRETIKRLDVTTQRETLQQAMNLRDEAWERVEKGMRLFSRPLRVAASLSAFTQSADGMSSEPLCNYVGRALTESLEAGMLLADVHMNNLGMPTGKLLEEIGHTCIITDPGHVVALDDRYDGVRIEEVG